MTGKVALLNELVGPVVVSLGYKFWGLEYLAAGRRSILRVYIDGNDGEGVNVDDCAMVSRQVSSVMDVEDPINGEYQLEVSSPGLDCLLFSLDHYQQFVGQYVDVKLHVPFEGRRRFKGLMSRVEDGSEEICVVTDGEEYTFPIEQIDKARVVPDFSSKSK